mmetsp:Transcript_454/g.661  ORF Transcript_454/g.661 Transcript_454/m.661 type:complete len:1353 (+) Transcript_454:201-4259(+)|eukprot:CAMPEP_0194217640 /NCGR_PEP_ID=MMETSP0156-20130528/21872_1 /TAXON_ID=33649 /ORGANISM="Thalassionema nitzschioides, Strain L26-B" /LENGTH=1352 /DNA_ID=CAMNT_0038946741 /DNA_START=113 /DNA_END=4171 /DNA_ORIENTATION=-
MTNQLPLKEEFDKAAGQRGKIKELLLQAFQWGTNYQRNNDPDLDQTRQASNLLVEVWKSQPQIESLLVDIIWMISCTSSCKSLSHILQALVLKVPERELFWKDLLGTLPDPNLLGSAQLIVEAQPKEAMMKKIRKVNTEMYYRQQKYNLLQEESQGYAKLLTILFSSKTKLTPQILQAHIGAFELDPNRVLDILLDQLEDESATSEGTNSILQILTKGGFDIAKISALCIFKLSSYTKKANAIPLSLYKTIVLLARKDLLDLSTLVPTSLKDLEDCFKIHERLLKLQISSLGRVSLNSDPAKAGNPKRIENQKALKEATHNLEINNPIVGLLGIILSSPEDTKSSWELACGLIPNVSNWTQICTLLPATIGQKLCNFIRSQVEPIYKEQKIVPELSDAISNAGTPTSDDGSIESLKVIFDSYAMALLALCQSGCLSNDPMLYCQLCRLTRSWMIKQDEQSELGCSSLVYALLQSVLIPSLSLMPPNPAISASVWAVLSILPYSTRYQLYRDWSGSTAQSSKPLIQLLNEKEAGKAARYTLKRLSKENVRDMGRQVSKLTHSNPLVVFDNILNQIESYDNLIQMMVETVRFVTPLSLDVLGYCILSRLYKSDSGVNRSRLKDDGINMSQWLQSLELFTGSFYKKCPDVEFRGILSYLVHRLKAGNVLELGILKTLIKTAGGYSFADYSPTASLSTHELGGRAGSLVLKRETFAFGIVDAINLRALERVRSVLQSQNLGSTILILLAQSRRRLVFDGSGATREKKHVKLIANLLDSCQVVMYMLLEFLTTDSLKKYSKQPMDSAQDEKTVIETYAASLPPLEVLLNKYQLDPVSAWMFCRPIFRALRRGGALGDEFNSHQGDRSSTIKGMLPEEVWKDLTTSLVDTFFSLSLYDIFFPESTYKAEIARLNDADQRLSLKKTNNQPGVMQFSREDEVALERGKVTLTVITEDMNAQKKHCEDIQKQIFTAEPFFSSEEIKVESIQTFITHCIYPRCRLSPDDAAYCVHFIMLLHRKKTAGFSTLHFIDEFIRVLCGSLYSSTEDEAAAMGIILLEFWKVVSRWRYDDEVFANEVAGMPGAMLIQEESGVCSEVGKDQYKSLYDKWHAAVGRAAIGCFDSYEYMHVRASLVVLSRMVEEFPTKPKLGQKLLKALEALQDDSYPLQDIKTTAHAYGTLLLKARSEGVWKEEDAATIKAREEKEKAKIAERNKRREEQLAALHLDTEKINKEIGESGRSSSRRPQNPTGGPQNHDSDSRRSDNDRSRPNSDRQQPQQSLEGRWERSNPTNANGSGNKRERSPPRRGGDDDHPGPKRQRTQPNGGFNFEPGPRSVTRGSHAHQQQPRSGAYRSRGATRR